MGTVSILFSRVASVVFGMDGGCTLRPERVGRLNPYLRPSSLCIEKFNSERRFAAEHAGGALVGLVRYLSEFEIGAISKSRHNLPGWPRKRLPASGAHAALRSIPASVANRVAMPPFLEWFAQVKDS
jgi:hypothetical protein